MPKYYTVKKTEELKLLTQEINNLQVRINEKKSLRPERWATVMEKLISWINDNINKKHGLITGAVAHYNLVRIHPFDDGNGRGARLLMNLIFIKKRLPPAVIRNQRRRLYLDTLAKADKEDLEPFVRFVGESLVSTQKVIVENL